jgi:hypothetical protein
MRLNEERAKIKFSIHRSISGGKRVLCKLWKLRSGTLDPEMVREVGAFCNLVPTAPYCFQCFFKSPLAPVRPSARGRPVIFPCIPERTTCHRAATPMLHRRSFVAPPPACSSRHRPFDAPLLLHQAAPTPL